MELVRNRLVADYARSELEDEFVRLCDQLDQKRAEIAKLNAERSTVRTRLAGIEDDATDRTKRHVRIEDHEMQLAFRQNQYTIKQLKDQLDGLEVELQRKRHKTETVRREVGYFHSLLSFPGTHLQSDHASQGEKAKLMKELIAILIDHTRKCAPPLSFVYQTAFLILSKGLEEAFGPFRELCKYYNLDHPLFACADIRDQIAAMNDKINECKRKLGILREKHAGMAKRHNEDIARFQNESNENHRKYKELLDLQHLKETKEAELSEIDDLKAQIARLKGEIQLLNEQRDSLEERNRQRLAEMEDAHSSVLRELKDEIGRLMRDCQSMRDRNARNEKICQQLIDSFDADESRRVEIRDGLQKIQEEYQALRNQLQDRIKRTGTNPFDSQRFVDFLSELSMRGWEFSTIASAVENISKLNVKMREVQRKTEDYTRTKELITEQIESCRQTIAELEAQGRVLMQ